jgi:hypothetical protein
MFEFLTSVLGLLVIGAYVYVAVMFGQASYKAGNSFGRVLVDATTWPVMGWQAIEDLYNR